MPSHAGRSRVVRRRPRLLSSGIEAPVLIVAGGARSLEKASERDVESLLKTALSAFHGTVLSGGTMCGVPGCLGAAADAFGPCGARPFRLRGYVPRKLPHDGPRDHQYRRPRRAGRRVFAEQILRNWLDILDAGIDPAHVRVLGFGGGKLAAMNAWPWRWAQRSACSKARRAPRTAS